MIGKEITIKVLWSLFKTAGKLYLISPKNTETGKTGVSIEFYMCIYMILTANIS